MKYGEPTALAIEELRRAGFSDGDIARRVGVKADDIRRLAGQYVPPREFDPTPIGEALELSGDFIVVGDVHVPYTDWDYWLGD